MLTLTSITLSTLVIGSAAIVLIVVIATICYRCLSPCRYQRASVLYKEVPSAIPAIHVSLPLSHSSNAALMAAANLRDAISPPWMNGNAHRMMGTHSIAPSPDGNARSLMAVNGLSQHAALFLFDDGSEYDEDIDDRSVLHYELGMYEKTNESCFRGTLTFALRYDFVHRVLMLHIVRANNLPVEEKGASVDPYVKMHLLPERKNHSKTKIARQTKDPEFNEVFSFDVSFNALSTRMLQLTVYDFERFTRHGLIGNVIMRDLFEQSDLYTWTEYTMQIIGSQEKNDFGDLLLYLSYSYQEQKLSIQVAKAYNLRPMDITGASDPYVKIEQIHRGRRVKLRKTNTKKANLNPVYHETLEFDLPSAQIDETNMLVQVMDWDRIGKDDLLGCCILGKRSCTAEGRNQWDQCFAQHEIGIAQSATTKPKPVGQWHSILEEIPEEFSINNAGAFQKRRRVPDTIGCLRRVRRPSLAASSQNQTDDVSSCSSISSSPHPLLTRPSDTMRSRSEGPPIEREKRTKGRRRGETSEARALSEDLTVRGVGYCTTGGLTGVFV
ncbi:snt-5 [Pristionchus pacificus]|uniref:Snt-5 n=1 Tax=Pristionchus pacificus TaxID=54126 RepID=A0A2A6C9X4_PRIPA|nr:snt-5 [Pristionchus pacificus]|eukprot:PDM74949.1 snt-5 [Pristionchus pacificus]